MVVCFIGVLIYFGFLSRKIDTKMVELKNTRPTQFFSVYPAFKINQKFRESELKNFLDSQGYVEASLKSSLMPSEYKLKRVDKELVLTIHRPEFKAPNYKMSGKIAEIVLEWYPSYMGISNPSLVMPKAPFFFESWEATWVVKRIELFNTHESVDNFENVPVKMGVFHSGRLRTQEFVPLSQIPTTTRLAIIAIEDAHFLEHHGLSFRAFIRALLINLKARRFAQGGSTITQQLMKNLFFSNQKEISRKVKEAILALITELRHSKEDILEAYLNEVYLGQRGVQEIHGFSEAAFYYFNKPINQLTLSESATLAAMIQAPNSYNPKNYSTKLLKKRNLVLEKMLFHNFITQEEYSSAIKEPIGIHIKENYQDDMYYAIDLIASNLPEPIRSKLNSRSYMIFSPVNTYLQKVASRAINQNLLRLKNSFSNILDYSKKGHEVESALVAIDVRDCSVLAISGGRGYKETQYNRVSGALRQPGSLFKPLVYLSALITQNYTPLSLIEDAPFNWEYDKKNWAPRNYDKKFRGYVTLRHALENSINVPTAKLAKEVGIENVVSVMKDAGIKSNLPELPSISLGSAEVTPLELATAFTTLANLGSYCEPRTYFHIFDDSGNLVDKKELYFKPRIKSEPVFQVVNMLKGVFTHGTAKHAKFPLTNFSGKTGTTNEYNDAWFVGFSPEILVLVWVGYDEKLKLGLTGASAALPAWISFMNNAHQFFSESDFVAPDTLIPVVIDRASNAVAGERCEDIVTEYFIKGTEPTEKCKLH